MSKTTTVAPTMPLAPLDEVNDLSRRYDTLKSMVATISLTEPVVFPFGITISSRFMLRTLGVRKADGRPVVELSMGTGAQEVTETWAK